ncbi:hypothetical protein Btru_016130 [Bulinus truncatus]|nr:hypothetical protein Btru_016130 [Bulinus truncatus]
MTLSNGASNWIKLQKIIKSKNGILILENRPEGPTKSLKSSEATASSSSTAKMCQGKSAIKSGLTSCNNALTFTIPEAHVHDVSSRSVSGHVGHITALTAPIFGRATEIQVVEEILNQFGKVFKDSLECCGITPDHSERILSFTMPNIKSALVQLKKYLTDDLYADCLIRCVDNGKETPIPIIFNVYNNFNSKRIQSINITEAGYVNLE